LEILRAGQSYDLCGRQGQRSQTKDGAHFVHDGVNFTIKDSNESIKKCKQSSGKSQARESFFFQKTAYDATKESPRPMQKRMAKFIQEEIDKLGVC
jgi:hypothetical protein